MKSKSNVARSQISKGSQSVRLVELLATADGRKLRLQIESDAYKFQCSAKIELWTGTEWSLVWAIPAAAMQTHEGLCYLPGTHSTDAVNFLADRSVLLDTASEILGSKVRA